MNKSLWCMVLNDEVHIWVKDAKAILHAVQMYIQLSQVRNNGE